MYDKAKALQEFHAALLDAGLVLSGPPVMDGELRRVPVQGERPGRKSGAYVGHLDNWPAGYICNWRTGRSEPWKAAGDWSGSAKRYTRTTAQYRAVREAKEAQIARGHEHAARYAASLYAASSVASEHPYLALKHVSAHSIRVSKLDRLLIPMRDIDGKLWSLQKIDRNGDKQFSWRGRFLGCFHTLGLPRDGAPLLIAEGYATAATLHEILALPVLVAFTAGNLAPVAHAARSRWPAARIIIAGDDDGDNRTDPTGRPLPNVGKLKATEAACQAGDLAVFPDFDSEDADGTDWNDLACLAGTGAVERQWRAALDHLS